MAKAQKYSKFPGFPAIEIDAETMNRIENDKNKPTVSSVLAETDRKIPGWRDKIKFKGESF